MNNFNFPEPEEIINIPHGIRGPDAKASALADLAHLWQLDNPAWVEQRQSDWLLLKKNIYTDTPKVELKVLEQYFKYGKTEEYISVNVSLMLTPYTNEVQLLQFFNSRLLGREDRESITSSLLLYLLSKYNICHWYESHMKLVVSALLGNTYRIIKEEGGRNRFENISPSPAYWCNDFVRKALKGVLTDTEWLPVYDCLDYFISILPYAIKEKFRKQMKLVELLATTNEALAEGQLHGRALIFAQALKAREQDILAAWDIGEQKIAAGMTE
jgi:hypothetical protein